ncbi:MAG: FapA family protein [Treponema sp.]|nr:FapA family protein [Treponema sp.]
MVDFIQLQELIKRRLERDRAIQSIEVTGPTLEAVIADAATMLNVPVRRLEYEITERGTLGLLGIGKKEWRIQAYEKVVIAQKTAGESLLEEEAGEKAPVIEDRDGEIFVFLHSCGDALLKVTAPSGNGRRATEALVMQRLKSRDVLNINDDMVKDIIDKTEGEYIKVGEFEHHSYNDSVVRTEIAEGEMKAYMIVKAPDEGGCDITFESYISVFKSSRIVHGIKEDALRAFIDKPIYSEKIEIAVGSPPINGKDAYIQYNFETDQSKVRLKEGSNGRIDFKELDIIQNVLEKQELAKKIPAGQGKPGETITGKWLPATNGKDIALPVGTNTHVGSDGDTILADMNGQVVIVSGLVNVEPVYTVNGDVNLKTGNIYFLGTVIVKGNIEDGFSVKAAGNIEVHGTVAKATLDAEGDIIIHQGVNGKDGGHIRAGKSLWARFIENANIESGDMVIVSDGILNSQVDASNRIIVRGKRASIMGGRLRASEEINAKVLGNPTTGTETICEVGFDPKSKAELDKLQEKRQDIDKQLEEINRNMQALINIKKQRKSLPEDKEAQLQELMDTRDTLDNELTDTKEKIYKIQEFLSTLKNRGKVSASMKVYPGVRIVIRDASDEVRTEYKAATFILENELIRVVKYEEPDESVKKGLDGYTTN